MRKGISFAVFILLTAFLFCRYAKAEDRVTQSDGTHRAMFIVTVGSGVATSPYDSFPGTGTLIHRNTLVINPSSSYVLMIGTWSAFTASDTWSFVPVSSGSWKTSNHQKFWLRYIPGGSSDSVKGVIEYE